MKWITIALLAALCCCLPACGGSSGGGITRTEFHLDTVCTITVYGTGKPAADAAITAAFKRCEQLEQLLSAQWTGSDVDKINRANGAPVAVSDETVAVLSQAQRYASLSDGLFDVTCGSLTALWNFSDPSFTLPDDAQLTQAMTQLGIEALQVSGNTVTLADGARLDLGGIAKGYIADQLAALLRQQGITSALVNLGGNIVAVGAKPDGQPFGIGVAKPYTAQAQLEGVLMVSGRAVSTAGVDERGVTIEGVRYHHILDIRTGQPAQTGLQAVTIVADVSMDADALSTTVFLLGERQGMALVETLDGVEAVLIRDDGSLSLSSGLQNNDAFQVS